MKSNHKRGAHVFRGTFSELPGTLVCRGNNAQNSVKTTVECRLLCSILSFADQLEAAGLNSLCDFKDALQFSILVGLCSLGAQCGFPPEFQGPTEIHVLTMLDVTLKPPRLPWHSLWSLGSFCFVSQGSVQAALLEELVHES